MYIPKRWLVPGALSVLLMICIGASALSTLHATSTVSPVQPFLAAERAAAPAPAPAPAPAAVVAAPVVAPRASVVAEPCVPTDTEKALVQYLMNAKPAPVGPPPPPREVATGANSATNSGVIANSQFNDGGFGDIGQQWRYVDVNGNVINVHVSGNGNTTSVIVGDAPTPTPPVDGTPAADPAAAPETPAPAASPPPAADPVATPQPTVPSPPAPESAPPPPEAAPSTATPVVG